MTDGSREPDGPGAADGDGADATEPAAGESGGERGRRAREVPGATAWPDFLSPDHVPPGRREASPEAWESERKQAQGNAQGDVGDPGGAGARATWPSAGAGDAPPAQVFRPETGRTVAPGEAEPGAQPLPDGGAGASGPAGAPALPRHGWNDGLIARRAPDTAAPEAPASPARRHTSPDDTADPPGTTTAALNVPGPETGRAESSAPETREGGAWGQAARPVGTGGLPSPDGIGGGTVGGALRRRLGALRELIGLSRTRLEGRVLAEAGRVLDEAGARSQLSASYTTVAIAGATGSGKSSLLNALAGRTLSETGLRRPTTAQPVACTWEDGHEGGADGLLDRLGIAPGLRRRVADASLHGLVLIDLPDHDSVAAGHREHVDRLLELVDAVMWVVDPEKYADALLHERYLRPLAGYAEVTFVVLNQVDRLPGDAADAVLHDLRRLLDEDGMALGDYGEPGARVLATSALTGEGLPELREELCAFAATREAPARRLTADLDGAAERLRRVYADPALPVPTGLTEADREEFEDLLASAVGACAAGQAAERVWLRHAEQSCGTPWSQFVRWRDARRRESGAGAENGVPPEPDHRREAPESARVARPVLTQAVRRVADRAAVGLPDAWRRTVRDAAWRGAEGLPEALDALMTEALSPRTRDGVERPLGAPRLERPPWWTVAMLGQGLLLALQVVGVFLLVGAVFGSYEGALWSPVLLVLGGAVAAPGLAAGCRAAARGPARAFGQEEERRLRRISAGCGRTRVLEPVAAELMRYREVREQYVVAAGDPEQP